MPILAVSILVSLLVNIGMFLIAYKKQSDKLTDISYAVTFILLTWLAVGWSGRASLYPEVLAAMIILWAVRIGGFLLMRVITVGKDSRFDGMREDFIKFGRFWLGQGIAVWILMIAGTLAMNHGGKFSLVGYIGIAVWLIGLTTEATADIQKFQFSQDPANKNKWIENGVWKYSRHPNYFGEILIWVGIYLVAYNGLAGYEKLVGLVSPLYICVLLLFVTGIPILEKSADKRWGKLPDYKTYKKRTSILVPLPPK